MNQRTIFTIILSVVILTIVGYVSFHDFFSPTVINQNQVSIIDDPQVLPIPLLLMDENPNESISDFTLVAQQGETYFFNGLATPTLGYNTSYLGPVIKVTRGQTVNMHVINKLSASTSVHWHGLEVTGTEDGGPHQVIAPGSQWNPSFVIDQPASTLWFHPHVIGSTATQVYTGLAGLILIEDDNSLSLNLPNDYGINDIPLIIQDRSFNSDGSFLYVDDMMNGVFGEYILVNGAITPYLDVQQVKMRFRILNGSNARNFEFKLSNQASFYQIASDGGLLQQAIELNELFLSPGERAEIIIDFSKYKENDVLQLMSNNETVMTFNVKEKSLDRTDLPEILAVIERLDESLATGIKTIELDGMGHMVTLNGLKFDMDRIDDNVAQNDIQIWEITSTTRMMMGSIGHPFHIHGTQFQILSRDGRNPQPNEMGWKDTVFVKSRETVRIIVQFKHKGLLMYHCHILEHEEAGMMGQLEVH